MKKRACLVLLVVMSAVSASFAQRAEVTISLNEPFFDALIDAIYQNSPAPQFPLSVNGAEAPQLGKANAFAGATPGPCGSVTLLRDNRSIKTAVRFREGKIYAPVAFSGSYNTPFIGCLDFTGYAESNVDLIFDQNAQKLLGRVRVRNVVLDGTAGIGSSLVARMVQGSIDRKLNPIEIINLDKLSFPFTLPNSAKLRMKATGVRHEVSGSALNIVISYEFVKDA